jgi:hypothetical protein
MDGDVHARGNLLVAQSLADQVHDLPFTSRQPDRLQDRALATDDSAMRNLAEQ